MPTGTRPHRLYPRSAPTSGGRLSTPLADLCAQLRDDAAMELSEAADHTEIIRYMERLTP
jgi:hypothetical protein